MRWLVIVLVCTGCSLSSGDDIRKKSERDVECLVRTLRGIERRGDALAAAREIEAVCERLVDRMIELEHLQRKGKWLAPVPNEVLSEALKGEFERLYEIEGVREVIEEAQRGALHRLDAHVRRSSDSKAFR